MHTSDGPAEFEEANPNLVDDVLKLHFPKVARTNSLLRRASVAGVWLALATGEDEEAAGLLRLAVRGGVDPYKAAISVAKQFGWSPGDAVRQKGAARGELEG